MSGKDGAAIGGSTGVSRRVIGKYVAGFAVGECGPGSGVYVGRELSTADRCRLLGT